MKSIDLRLPVQKLCMQYPELIGIMQELGFTEITKPGMLATVGRFMTLPKGAVMRGINMDTIKQALVDKGFKILDEEEEQ